MEKAFCFCDGVMMLSPNVVLSICAHLRGVRSLWVNVIFRPTSTHWNLELYELTIRVTISGDFFTRNDLSDPSPLGNVFLLAVSKPDQFADSLEVDFDT